jgi:hypothetical protein
LVNLRGLKFRFHFLRGRTQQHRVELGSGISLNSSTRLSGFFSAIGASHLASSGPFFGQTNILNTKIGGDEILSELIEEIDFLALGLPEAEILSGTPNASVLIGSLFCPCLDKYGEHRFLILFCRRTEC